MLLIFDEVVTGFRLALGSGQAYHGVTPDLATFGKIVGGGGPLGCVAGRAEVIDRSNPRHKGQADYAYINGTLHGNPLAAVAGLATLHELEQPGFYEKLHQRCDELTGMLQAVFNRHGLPAIAAGRASFWQLLWLREEPRAQTEPHAQRHGQGAQAGCGAAQARCLRAAGRASFHRCGQHRRRLRSHSGGIGRSLQSALEMGAPDGDCWGFIQVMSPSGT